ncbi:centromere protein K isoform X2 [Hippocampus comes]|uniref:centromere protein K isoform X2 n=1 Tax=Hippocampus comes TaxID=109280 RepID=UPI00094E8491|nr:PREDICTED: centromere protein K isoform X2 [Hippocampus comes]
MIRPREWIIYFFKDDVKQGNQALTELSEAAQVELVNQCEQQFAQLDKLQNKIILCEPDQCENNQAQSVNRLLVTKAEMKQWVTVEPRLLAENSEVLLKAGKEEMLKVCSELEMVLSCYEAKRDKLRETKELEQKWLEEKGQVLSAATEHAKRLQEQSEKLSEHSVLLETKEKINKMKDYKEKLMESLGDILEKHVPPPCNDLKTNKNIPNEVNEDLIPLSDILELLMNKALNTPHDPYVAIDSTFWPPYVEMLLRHGIAVRHRENNFKIRLETFF